MKSLSARDGSCWPLGLGRANGQILLEVNRVPVVAVLPLVSTGLHGTPHRLASDQGNGKRAVVLALSEVRRVVERVCARQDVLDACARRDLGLAIAVLNENGVTQGQIASLTGLHQNRLSDYKTGKHRPTEYSVFAAFADGLGLPPAARQALGLDASPPAAAGIGVPQPRPASFTEVGLEYPGTPVQAAGNVASLWQADLADQGVLAQTSPFCASAAGPRLSAIPAPNGGSGMPSAVAPSHVPLLRGWFG
jgi:transcriptional regulator with XRE-family HTH domain